MVCNVLIHGFGGCPKELKHLNAYLLQRGLVTYIITLAGHGGTKRDLHKTSYKDWLKSAHAEVAQLVGRYDKVNLIGFSMGGLICVRLAQKFKINRIVLINTPVFFWNIPLITKRIFKDLLGGKRDNINYFLKSTFRVSLKSSIDFLKILFTTLPTLKHIRNKTLILQCLDDETVYYRSAFYLKRVLGKKAKLHLFKGGCHLVFVNDIILRDKYNECVYKFVKDVH